jgi:hypothetical protein
MTLDLDGNVRDYPAGWTPLGWTTLDYFLLQREQDDAVTFAVGDARKGELYDLFPRNQLREVLERRLEHEALTGAADPGRAPSAADTNRAAANTDRAAGAQGSQEWPKP